VSRRPRADVKRLNPTNHRPARSRVALARRPMQGSGNSKGSHDLKKLGATRLLEKMRVKGFEPHSRRRSEDPKHTAHDTRVAGHRFEGLRHVSLGDSRSVGHVARHTSNSQRWVHSARAPELMVTVALAVNVTRGGFASSSDGAEPHRGTHCSVRHLQSAAARRLRQ
jgi:hypothetical protein